MSEADQPCAGPCNNRARREWEAYEVAAAAWQDADRKSRGQRPAEPRVHVSYGDPIFCEACTSMIREELPALAALMEIRLKHADGFQVPVRQPDRVTTSKTAATSPSPAVDDLDELVRWLQEQESRYLAAQGWQPRLRRAVGLHALVYLLDWFQPHLDTILTIEGMAADFGNGVLRWHTRLQHATAARLPRRHKPLPCPWCRRFTLFLHDDEQVHCHGNSEPFCGRILTGDEYAALELQADQQVAS